MVTIIGGVALGISLGEIRARIPRADGLETAVLAPSVTFLAAQHLDGSLTWLRLALLIFLLGRVLGPELAPRGSLPPAEGAATQRGNLHLIPFLPVLASGWVDVRDFWSMALVCGELCFASFLAGSPHLRARWAAVLVMLTPMLGHFHG